MSRKRQGWLFSSLLVAGLSGLMNPAYGAFPLPPRLSGLVLASDYTVGQADAMFPLSGDMSRNLYVDPALSYGTDNQNQFDVGLGYRWITNQAAIVGGYFFGGYSRVDNNARLWIANPGIEAFGSRWDAHLNAYIPMGDRHYTAGTEIVHFFTGHSEFGRVFLMHQYAGSGADIKAGYQLFPHSSLKGYLGSYYFSPAETNNVWGGAAGLEYWLTQGVKLIGSYSYDNLHHSTYAFGIGLEWGGLRAHRADPELEERLTDPVERHVAELGRGSTIPTRLKAKPLLVPRGGMLVIDDIPLRSNIAFFSQTGQPNDANVVNLTLGSCTFENPCGPADFTQANVTTLNDLIPNTQFYFNGGTYTTASSVNLFPGQSVQSRTADYSQLATDPARSTLILPTISLQGNNTLENIILLSNQPTDSSVIVTGGNNIIRGSDIGNSSGPGLNRVAVFDLGATNTLIDNSVLNALRVGVTGRGSSNLVIQNSEINVANNEFNSIDGVRFENTSGSIVNTDIFLENDSAAGGSSNGVFANGGSIVDITNSLISVNNIPSASAIGIQTNGAGTAVTMTGREIVLNSGGSNAITFRSDGSTVTFDGVICSINGGSVVCS
ncbi:inverse autotransporter beta-barrel domain-containing protein [Rickettsiella grylli]|uniref:Inverse autotransporter beta-domain domain-containing protein n=1 Tax=Rickettsiella grylli TaxID=59196 RepID=A8PQ96_9COXI|nr:inverse autotransporter beta-barrel domain-containing protein [Rickettsiella grylli]EDP45889.1 hypothetical protein RICGR_1456 [Rickettsiella grylli]